MLIVMPWWPAFWEHNFFMLEWPSLRVLLANDFVRGAVTGLGIVNLWAGVADLGRLFSARDPDEMSLDDRVGGAGQS